MKTGYRIIRTAAVVMLALTVGMTLLGGIGSTCVAFGAERFDSMRALIPYQWLYQILVVVSIAAGAAGIRALIGMARGTAWSYREALIVLLVGGGAALIQVIASRALRGKSMPTDVRLYITLLTLILFLFMRIPRIRRGVGLGAGSSAGGIGGGAAALVLGALILTVHHWTGVSHRLDGINYADVWHSALAPIGWSILALGVGLACAGILRRNIVRRCPPGEDPAAVDCG